MVNHIEIELLGLHVLAERQKQAERARLLASLPAARGRPALAAAIGRRLIFLGCRLAGDPGSSEWRTTDSIAVRTSLDLG